MKTLDQIIEREDYQKINSALKDRAIELGKKLSEACLKIKSHLGCQFRLGGVVFEFERKKSNSGFSETFLYIYYEEYSYCIEVTQSFYYANDFNCWVKAAPSAVLLYFLNNAKAIFADLEQTQNEIISQCEKALKDVENL